MARIGTCDLCAAQNVELSRGDMAGLETWYCTDGCKSSFSVICRDNEPAIRKMRQVVSRYRNGEMISLTPLESDVLVAGLDLLMLRLDIEKGTVK